jgi:CRISPR-associated protein Cas2
MTVLAWMIYDIREDKIRGFVAKECKKAGLIRVQQSVFLGKLDNNRFDELGELCQGVINPATDSVYLFPFSQENFQKIRVLGQGFDRKMVNDEILSQFF